MSLPNNLFLIALGFLLLTSCSKKQARPYVLSSSSPHESLRAYEDARDFNAPGLHQQPFYRGKSNTPSGYSTGYANPTTGYTNATGYANQAKNYTPTMANVSPNSLTAGMRDSEAMQRATMRPYSVGGKTYYPTKVAVGQTFDGYASWYGPNFHAKRTSNGETYNMYAHTAANKTLPMNTIVKVTNKDNNKSTIVRINDRGPFVPNRIIDLSSVAARDIDMVGKGVAPVRLKVLGFGGVISKRYAQSLSQAPQNHTLQKEFKIGQSQKTYSGGNFSLQVGAFRNKEGALKAQNALQASVKKRGYHASVVEGSKDNQPIYRVFIGSFKSEDEANDYAKSMPEPSILVRE